MIEPLPKARSICDSAASSALVLSTEVPSTRRRLACVTALFLLARSAVRPQQRPQAQLCACFVLIRKRYLFPLCPFSKNPLASSPTRARRRFPCAGHCDPARAAPQGDGKVLSLDAPLPA